MRIKVKDKIFTAASIEKCMVAMGEAMGQSVALKYDPKTKKWCANFAQCPYFFYGNGPFKVFIESIKIDEFFKIYGIELIP